MEIKTERLLIRPFLESDGEDLYEYLSDPVVAKSDCHEPLDRAAAYGEAKRRASDECFFAVCLGDKLIGNIFLCKHDFCANELGYVFNRNYWGQGYAFEAASAVLSYAFEKLGARRIVAMCNPLNNRSWKLLERLGMRREGFLLQHISFFKDENGEPIWQDTFEYAILKSEFDGKKK